MRLHVGRFCPMLGPIGKVTSSMLNLILLAKGVKERVSNKRKQASSNANVCQPPGSIPLHNSDYRLKQRSRRISLKTKTLEMPTRKVPMSVSSTYTPLSLVRMMCRPQRRLLPSHCWIYWYGYIAYACVFSLAAGC